MVKYEVTVFTSNWVFAATSNPVFIKLVGKEGESKRTLLASWKGTVALWRGQVAHFTVSCPKSLGPLFLIELHKQHWPLWEDSWFPAKVEVRSPEGETYCFPLHTWLTDSEVYGFREGKAMMAFQETQPQAVEARENELIRRKNEYNWHEYEKGLPECNKETNPLALPPEVRFSFTKEVEFGWTALAGAGETLGLGHKHHPWANMKDFDQVYSQKTTEISDYVKDHWQEDEFFASQYLNGVNPIMIRCCKKLPENFAVTDGMLFPDGGHSLTKELESGNIFICDYKNLDGVPANIISGKQQYMMAPLVLLHKTEDKLLPIAIQLKQTPADDNPVFLPTDCEYDWLMAKIFVRSADFQEHELNVHLLRTHLLAEVFTVSLLRNLPRVHPLYKLLVPNTRYTLQINTLARLALISENGVFTKFAASGGTGMLEILRKSLSSITYSSLCIPDDIADRGVKDIPNYHYRDDALGLWNIIFSFVKRVISFYYKTDEVVKKDQELQDWVREIFVHGFLSKKESGIPEKLCSVAELIKFVTMVMFTCSGQHSAVNTGQYDYGAWMPNTPISLQRPPPTKKGGYDDILLTLPDISTTAQGLTTLWLLSKQSTDFVAIGQYPEEYFTEESPRKSIHYFQKELCDLSHKINIRNFDLAVQYKYLNPPEFENSVSI